MTYIPGMCNITPKGRRKRLFIAAAFLAISAALYLSVPYRIVLAVPVFIASVAFIEYIFGFCAYLGLRGRHEDEKGVHYTNQRYIAADRRKVWKIILAAAAFTAVVTALII